MKNLILRTVSGFVFLIVITGSILSGPFVFGTVFFIITLLGMNEFYKMVSLSGYKPDIVASFITATIFYWLTTLYTWQFIETEYLFIPVAVLFYSFIARLYRAGGNPMADIATGMLGIVYVALPFTLLNFFFHPEMQFAAIPVKGILLGFFIIIWVNDTFAYLTGRVAGRHKLFERISPKKTIEGSAGGFIFSMVAAYILSLFFNELTPEKWFGFAIVTVVFATFGDLTESMFKRSCNIKDSGNIMPGHGGVLDRFDSVLIAAPFVFLYLLIIL